MKSLTARVIISTIIVLALFIGLTGLALERAFQNSSQSAIQDRLQAQLYVLMAETEVSPGLELSINAPLPVPRLNLPGSGLYAWIMDQNQQPLWQSTSTTGTGFIPELRLNSFPGIPLQLGGEPHLYTSISIEWEVDNQALPLTFVVAEDMQAYQQELASYRNTLRFWLGIMSFILLLALGIALYLGLKPLRRAASDIASVEAGTKEQLDGEYPTELQALTDNINTLIKHERVQMKRYRDALSDLAHSLKTPLAIMHGLISGKDDQEVSTQLQRMDEIVQYQLQRASNAGRSALAPPIPIAPIFSRLLNTLEKVYIDRSVHVETDIPEGLQIRGDQGDMMEMIGNVLDNAFKWTSSSIWVRVHEEDGKIILCIEDDGPGISAEQAQLILNRGVRMDEQTPGHGIGLAIVLDIVTAYNGTLELQGYDKGARIRIILPQD
jgi:two-component system sensor histidine kinase PhoQ